MIFLDFETTGLKNPAPVSLCIMFYENGKKKYQSYEIINPEKEIEYGAFKTHGISQEEAKEHYPFPILWEEIGKYFENSIVIGHNVRYDFCFTLLPTLKRYNLRIPEEINVLDTLENAKKLISKTEIKNYKLNTLCDYLNIKFDEETQHHSAFWDTFVLPKIYNKLVKLSHGDLIIRDINYNIIDLNNLNNKEEII